MVNFLIASGIIMVVLIGWVLVMNLARRFAENNPEFGPYVEKRGCGGNCSCGDKGNCEKNQ